MHHALRVEMERTFKFPYWSNDGLILNYISTSLLQNHFIRTVAFISLVLRVYFICCFTVPTLTNLKMDAATSTSSQCGHLQAAGVSHLARLIKIIQIPICEFHQRRLISQGFYSWLLQIWLYESSMFWGSCMSHQGASKTISMSSHSYILVFSSLAKMLKMNL